MRRCSASGPEQPDLREPAPGLGVPEERRVAPERLVEDLLAVRIVGPEAPRHRNRVAAPLEPVVQASPMEGCDVVPGAASQFKTRSSTRAPGTRSPHSIGEAWTTGSRGAATRSPCRAVFGPTILMERRSSTSRSGRTRRSSGTPRPGAGSRRLGCSGPLAEPRRKGGRCASGRAGALPARSCIVSRYCTGTASCRSWGRRRRGSNASARTSGRTC